MDDNMSTWSDDSLFKVPTATTRPRRRRRFHAVKSARRAGKRIRQEMRELVDAKALWAALVKLWKDLKSQGVKLKDELKAIGKLPLGSEEQMAAVWELIKRIAVKIGKTLMWVIENFNLWPDHSLERDNIKNMSDEDLLRKNNSTIRAVSGSVTGVLVCGAITAGCHLFAVPLTINFWQLTVSIVNQFRVAWEMKRRRLQRPCSFRNAEEQFRRLFVNRPGFHVFLGCVVKVGMLAGAVGIVGFASVMDGFVTQFSLDATAASEGANTGFTNIVENFETQFDGDSFEAQPGADNVTESNAANGGFTGFTSSFETHFNGDSMTNTGFTTHVINTFEAHIDGDGFETHFGGQSFEMHFSSDVAVVSNAEGAALTDIVNDNSFDTQLGGDGARFASIIENLETQLSNTIAINVELTNIIDNFATQLSGDSATNFGSVNFAAQFDGDGAAETDAVTVGAVAKSALPVHGVAPAHVVPVPHPASGEGTGASPDDAASPSADTMSAANRSMVDALKENPTLYQLADGAGNAASPGQLLDKAATCGVTGDAEADAIHMSTPAADLSRMIHGDGIPAHKVVFAALIVAITNEIFQPIAQLFEIAINKLIDKKKRD